MARRAEKRTVTRGGKTFEQTYHVGSDAVAPSPAAPKPSSPGSASHGTPAPDRLNRQYAAMETLNQSLLEAHRQAFAPQVAQRAQQRAAAEAEATRLETEICDLVARQRSDTHGNADRLAEEIREKCEEYKQARVAVAAVSDEFRNLALAHEAQSPVPIHPQDTWSLADFRWESDQRSRIAHFMDREVPMMYRRKPSK